MGRSLINLTALVSMLAALLLTSRAEGQPVLPPAPAGVQVTREYGIEFSTIRAAGNAPLPAPGRWTFQTIGRSFGGVAYDYRLSRAEIATSQWMEFVNTFSTQADFPQQLFGGASFVSIAGYPTAWGARPDQSYIGPGIRYSLINYARASDFPVAGITWRDAAMFCNWLHNGKSSDRATLWQGAYDTTTFGLDPVQGITDQVRRSPGARFWIPDLDEWAKAAFFDPNKNGPGAPGYWQYAISSDTAPNYGFPENAGTQANAGTAVDPFDTPEWRIPVGSYALNQSPWGIVDAAGSAAEWTEDPWDPLFRTQSNGASTRFVMGSGGSDDLLFAISGDRLGRFRSARPDGAYLAGFRVASVIPSPSLAMCALAFGCVKVSWRRR